MKQEYIELRVQDIYTIRGIYSKVEEARNIVVFFHGYTGNKNENAMMFKNLSKELANIGYSSLRFDFFGISDSDGDFEEQTFTTIMNDAKTILDYAYQVNINQKVIVLGFSCGGLCASYLSTLYPDMIEKLVLLSPAGNMKQLLEAKFKTHSLIDNKYLDEGGFCVSNDFITSLEGIDIYSSLSKFNGEVLVCQGGSDITVFPYVSKKICEGYSHSSYYVVEGAPHCYSSVLFRRELFDRILDFLK